MEKQLFSNRLPFEKIYLVEDVKDLSFIPGNRVMKSPQVKSIYNAFMRGKWVEPIFVTKEGQVADGQHRLTAFRMIRNEHPEINAILRVIVINSQESPLELAIRFNSKRLNWTTKDYMGAYLEANVHGYCQLRDFIKAYPEFEIKAAIQLIKGSHSTDIFKSGTLTISDAEYIKACSRAGALYCIFQVIKNPTIYRRDVVVAFYNIYDQISNLDKYCNRLKDFKAPSTEKCSDWMEAYTAIL